MSEENKTEQAPSAKKAPSKKRRGAIVAAVVVVVVVVAGAGFWVWHEQPSFCDAICHSPMDGYVQTLEAEAGEPAVDKWGNEVSDGSAMLASVHGQEADMVCLDCHPAVLEQQVSEGMKWIAGDYYFPLEERDLEDLMEYQPGKEYEQFCLNESCHNMTREELAESTSDLEINPHDDPHATLECSTCHKAHRASVMYCTGCHEDECVVPDGWLTYDEAREMETY